MKKVMGTGHTISATFTRPANATAYANGDVVCNSTSAPTIMTFRPVAKMADGHGAFAIIQQAILIDSASVATKPDLELWLFDTAITMDNDNAAFTPTDAELATLVGVIPFPTASFRVGDATVGAGGNSICDVQNLGLPVNVITDNVIYGVLVARNAYIPVSGESFTIRLKMLD